MTREETQQKVEYLLSRLRYNRAAHVVELTPAECGKMYDMLLAVQRYVAGPEAPEVRRLAQEWRNYAGGPMSERPPTVTVTADALVLLCDAILAFTVPS